MHKSPVMGSDPENCTLLNSDVTGRSNCNKVQKAGLKFSPSACRGDRDGSPSPLQASQVWDKWGPRALVQLLSPTPSSKGRWGKGLPCLAANAPEPRGKMENRVSPRVILILPHYRMIESLRLEKTSKIIKSNRHPNTTMAAKPYPEVSHPCVFWTPPGMGTPPLPWAACSNAWPRIEGLREWPHQCECPAPQQE